MRVLRAAELLSGTRLPLKEIGARVGVARPGTFGRIFRAWCGISPSEFRKRNGRISGGQLALLAGGRVSTGLLHPVAVLKGTGGEPPE
jgi:AraC-like DNA-binding protein